MTLDQLRQLVEETEHLSGETPVYMAQQPSYPLQTTISRYEVVGCDDAEIAELEEFLEGVEPDTDESDVYEARTKLQDFRATGNQTSVIYLAEGSQVYDEPYLPGHVSTVLGWR